MCLESDACNDVEGFRGTPLFERGCLRSQLRLGMVPSLRAAELPLPTFGLQKFLVGSVGDPPADVKVAQARLLAAHVAGSSVSGTSPAAYHGRRKHVLQLLAKRVVHDGDMQPTTGESRKTPVVKSAAGR